MKPIEFLTHVESYNDPHGKMMELITESELKISDGHNEYRVLSYYPTYTGMCLDIERIDNEKD